jgi:hypothetical protein
MSPSVYSIMPDQVLAEAILKLERVCSQLEHASGEIGERIRCGYIDALDYARAEIERRRV